jgi:hypothetical protein
MTEDTSANRDLSMVYDGAVGQTLAATSVGQRDYLIDPKRFPSEGNWAFCRFDSEEVPALRLGFQRGGFNGGFVERQPSPLYLQLHLEVMTREGAILWLPSGIYRADNVISGADSMNIRLDQRQRNILSFRGWPTIDCHMCSDEGDLQVDLQFCLRAVTVLPDSRLPFSLFGMWESMGSVNGSVRYQDRAFDVSGTVFFDHTRVIPRRHRSIPRHMYVYTTLFFEDGSGLFGYHSVDSAGNPVDGYCFHVYLDGAGNGRMLEDSELRHLGLDHDGIANSWELCCKAQDFSVVVSVTGRHSKILRSWGAPGAPQSRRDYSIIPLVLDGSARRSAGGYSKELKAYGLAEYFNADLWPADMAASPGTASAADAIPTPRP